MTAKHENTFHLKCKCAKKLKWAFQMYPYCMDLAFETCIQNQCISNTRLFLAFGINVFKSIQLKKKYIIQLVISQFSMSQNNFFNFKQIYSKYTSFDQICILILVYSKMLTLTSIRFGMHILASHLYLHFSCNTHYVWIAHFGLNAHISYQIKYNRINQI